nr:hypothetical protein Iba_chr14eCG10940 [Ipomoea batatas]
MHLKANNIRNGQWVPGLPDGHMHLKANSVNMTSTEKDPLSTKSPLKRSFKDPAEIRLASIYKLRLRRPHQNVPNTTNTVAKAAATTPVAGLDPIYTTSTAISATAAATAVTLVETYE